MIQLGMEVFSSLHNIDVANGSNAAAGGLDRTGGITGSRMRWIAIRGPIQLIIMYSKI